MADNLHDTFVKQADELLNNAKFQKDLRARFTDTFSYRYENYVRELADELAKEEAEKFINEMRKQLSMVPPE